MPAGSPAVSAMRGKSPCATPPVDPQRQRRPGIPSKPVRRTGHVTFPRGGSRRRPGRAAGAAIPGRPRRPCAARIAWRAARRWRSLDMSSVRRSMHLDQVPAERRLHRLGSPRRSAARPWPARIRARCRPERASPGRRPREALPSSECSARELGEISAVVDALAQLDQALARLALGHDLAGPDQDVARVRLLRSCRPLRPPRLSSSFTMWKPFGLRRMGLTSPGCRFASASTNSPGSRAAVRQPSWPPCSASGASEKLAATCAKSAPPRSCVQSVLGARAPLLHLLGLACSGTTTRMWARLYSSPLPSCASLVVRKSSISLSAHDDLRCRPRARAAARAESRCGCPRGTGEGHAVPLERVAKLLAG